MILKKIVHIVSQRTINKLLLKLTPMVYRVIKPHRDLMSYDEAIRKLNEFSPDQGRSACWEDMPDYKDKKSEWDLDIIIPCYNAQGYVRECLDSCLNQKTSYNFRLIVIDDGSKDATASIVDEYVDFKNVKIIHQENRGHSGARNAGLDISNAQYITFLDSDDTLPDNAIQLLMDAAMENDAEIAGGGIVRSMQTVRGVENSRLKVA